MDLCRNVHVSGKIRVISGPHRFIFIPFLFMLNVTTLFWFNPCLVKLIKQLFWCSKRRRGAEMCFRWVKCKGTVPEGLAVPCLAVPAGSIPASALPHPL